MELSLDTTLEVLHKMGKLCNPGYYGFYHAGFRRLKDFVDYDIHSLRRLRIPEVGRQSLQEVIDLLQSVKLKRPVSNTQLAPNHRDSGFEKVSELLNQAYQSIVHAQTKEAWVFKTIYPNVYMLHLALMDEKQPWLVPEEGMSLKSHLSIRQLIRNYLRKAMDLQESAGFPHVKLFATYQILLRVVDEHLELSYMEKYRYFLTGQKRQMVLFFYQNLLKESPKALRALIEKNNLSLERWIELNESRMDGYIRLFHPNKSEEVMQTFFQFGKKLYDEIDYWLSVDIEMLVDEWALWRYRQLGLKAFAFIRSFYVKYGYAPLWYVMYKSFVQATSLKEKVFCMRFGLVDGRRYTINEIAAACHRQPKYVSLLTSQAQELLKGKALAYEDWSVYEDLLNLPFITQETPEFLAIKKRESLTVDLPAFYGLLQLLGEHNRPCEKYAKEGESNPVVHHQYQLYVFRKVALIINRKLLPSFDVNHSFVRLKLLCGKTHYEDRRVFVQEALRKTLDPERAVATEVMIYLAKQVLNVEVAEDGSFHPERVRLDI